MKSISRQIITAMMAILGAAEMRAQVSPRSEPRIVPGQVIIKFRSESKLNASSAAASLEALGMTVIKSLSPLPIVVCKFSAEKNIDEVLRSCRALSNVEYVEPNYYVHALEGEPAEAETKSSTTAVQQLGPRFPNDPRFNDQWSLNNSNDADIDAPEAWDLQTGSSNVIVGIVDTGVDYDHEDLKDNIWRNPGESGGGKENNGIDDDSNGYIDDWRGWNFVFNKNDPYDDNDHGTFSAGVIGASGNNGKGIAGINWRVQLMPLKFLDRDGSGSTQGAAEAIIYAVKNGAKVLNNSWGGGEFSRLLEDVIKYADQNGALFIAGAGGGASNLDCFPVYPANYDLPNVIAVTRSDRNDNFVSSGNYGRRTVHLVAPSSSILSTQPFNRYQFLSGTAHTAHVSGVCALIWANYSKLTARQVLVRLLGSVDRKPDFIKRTITGGRLNAASALSTKPAIAYTTARNITADPIGPFLVKTSVVDDGALLRVFLVYSKNGINADTLEMTSSEQNVYVANIPAQPVKTTIQYAVLAIDNDGNRTMSESFDLLVGAAPIPLFTRTQFPFFTNNARPTFYWEDLPEAVAYHVNIAVDPNFSLSFIDSTTVPAYTPPVPLPDGDWSIRLRSVSRYNLLSAWSDEKRFTIDTVAPVIITMNINGGASYTNERAVTLNLEVFGAQREVDSLRLGNSSDPAPTEWRLFMTPNISWELAEGEDGLRTVFVEFKDRAGNISDAGADSIVLERQKPFFPVTTPRLSVARPALNQAVTVTIEPPKDSGVGIKSFDLFYRRAGESWQLLPFKNDTATIPKEFVTARGVDYRIIAEDSVGNRSILPDGVPDFFSIPVSIRPGEAGSSPGLPGGTTASAYRLISLPLMADEQAVSEVFTNLGVYGAKRDYRLWRLEANKRWREEGDQLKVQPGESYFLIKRESNQLSNKSAGTTAKATDGALGNFAGWQLRSNDWTLLGNPFNFEIALGNLWLKNRKVHLDSMRNVWSYDGSWEMSPTRLEPWGGIVVYNSGNADTLIFDANPSASPMAKSGEGRRSNSVLVQYLGEDEWALPIRAESRAGRDDDNYFGVRRGAKAGLDEFDYHEPPLLPDGLSLSFIAGDDERRRNLAVDIRPPHSQGYEWTLLIQSQSENVVNLRFEELEKLPPELEIWLVDDALKITQNLRKQGHYAVAGAGAVAVAVAGAVAGAEHAKQLKLVVGKREFVDEKLAEARAIPTTYELSQNFPNPFNPATTIRYGLPKAERVTLKIYNLLGAEVATLVNDEPQAAGYHAAIWDGRDKNGRVVASGVYVYRMQAGGFVMTKKLALVK